MDMDCIILERKKSPPMRGRRNASLATTGRRPMISTNCTGVLASGIGAETAAETNYSRRGGSNSLDRNNNKRRDPAARGLMPLGQRHRENSNEKIAGAGDHVQRLSSRTSFYKLYDFGTHIGAGNFSEVYLVHSYENSAKFAVKEIDKNRLGGKLHFVENEIAILKNICHRNICQLVEAFECSYRYFLVFEYAQKGDLFETVKRVGKLGERFSATVTRQVALALDYLHRRQIVHRDVKPENILLTADFVAKLTDFGLACTVLGPLYRVCGTPTYVAPEILIQEGYGIEVDVWSLGVILYVMLAGFPPFRSSDRTHLFKLITRANVSFEMPCWSRVSSNAKRLIMKMLTVDVGQRVSATEVISDEWVLEHGVVRQRNNTNASDQPICHF